MSQVQGSESHKTFDEEKEYVINSVPKSTTVDKKLWVLQIFR